MLLTSILLVLLVGFVLMLLEVFVVPGTTVIGVLGLAVVAGAIYWSFQALGHTAGYSILGGSLVLSVVLLYIGIKTRVWDKLMLNTNVEGRTESMFEHLNVGDKGIALSRIAPVGKAKFGAIEVEVESTEGFINERVEIEIESIRNKQVYVRKLIYAA